jgi:hypothetical protein
MSRGHSLEQDLRLLINNQKYSDMEILCEDEKILYCSRAILAARSEVFDKLLYNGMKESYEKQISFPEINSSGMEIILEYIYTGSVKEDSLTKDNIIEAFNAADYFQLPDLQTIIALTVEINLLKNQSENYSPELLSKAVNTMPLSEDNILLNLFVDAVAIIPLNTIEFGRLSIAALQYLLSCTHEKERPFATSEYEVFRYSAILAAKKVSNDVHKTLMGRLPTLEQIESSNVIQAENKFINDNQQVVKELEPLVKFIDFRRINSQILADIIEPLEIVPAKIILNVYRYIARSNANTYLNEFRGIPQTMYVWDKFACGPKLIIEDNGKVVHAPNDCKKYQNARSKMLLNNGIFEWDVIIEKDSRYSFVGVCASENFDYEKFAGSQPTGWVLSSQGYCWNSGNYEYYCPPFEDGTKITVHLDMNKKTCAFTVNGTKYMKVPGWNNLPSKLYSVVSLVYPGRFLIQPR